MQDVIDWITGRYEWNRPDARGKDTGALTALSEKLMAFKVFNQEVKHEQVKIKIRKPESTIQN